MCKGSEALVLRVTFYQFPPFPAMPGLLHAPKAAVSVDKQGKFAAWGISGHLIVVVLGQFSPDMLFVKFRKDGHKTFRKKLL